MRSHRRRLPTPHVLLAGDLVDLPGITAALAWLPGDAYGQVLVEVPHGEELPILAAPPRVTVHRVDASPYAAGLAIGRAVDLWVEEWIPDEPDERRAVSMWVGGRVASDRAPIGVVVERL